MTQSRTKSRIISRTVIHVLAAAGAATSVVVAPNSLILVDKYFKHKDRANAKYTLRYLKYRKLIEVKQRGGQQYYRLTSKGHHRYQQMILAELEIKSPVRWDHRWRLVLFDIPEKYRPQREDLRRHLKELGFYMLQQSAWIHPFDCETQIGFILDYLNLDKYTTYAEIDSGNFIEHATKYFVEKKLLI